MAYKRKRTKPVPAAPVTLLCTRKTEGPLNLIVIYEHENSIISSCSTFEGVLRSGDELQMMRIPITANINTARLQVNNQRFRDILHKWRGSLRLVEHPYG